MNYTIIRPETMGAVCAVVYLLIIIVFIPFPFYKDIVAATSGGGNRDIVIELDQVETGRLLHRFPHSKVGGSTYLLSVVFLPLTRNRRGTARIIPLRHPVITIRRHPRRGRRSI